MLAQGVNLVVFVYRLISMAPPSDGKSSLRFNYYDKALIVPQRRVN